MMPNMAANIPDNLLGSLLGNLLILNKRNDLIYSKGNVWTVIGSYTLKDLQTVLPKFGDTAIRVQFKTAESRREADIKTYTRRLRKLQPFFTFRSFRPTIINGYEQPNTMSTILLRSF